ncbi:hypothetical protein C2W64_02534 [Brevibacillus laterosporus]|nr:hypothetical protein C2W64_02534 [Brevibacillus laterosporus]
MPLRSKGKKFFIRKVVVEHTNKLVRNKPFEKKTAVFQLFL